MTSVALIVHDTLRKDAFDEHFDWLPGVRYEHAWSPSHWTAPVHASIFTGKYPSEVGVHGRSQHFTKPEAVLAELLQNNGYTTRAFSANANISVRYGFDRGFQEFECPWKKAPFNHDVTDIRAVTSQVRGWKKYPSVLSRILTDDSDTVDSLTYTTKLFAARKMGAFSRDSGAQEALDFVTGADFGEDEFLFMNLDEVHTPYDPPSEYQTTAFKHMPGLKWMLSTPEVDGEVARQAYDDCVRYASDIYEEIFSVLEGKFDYIITLADHGELFGEHGAWQHDHGLYPELTHVPLCIYDGIETSVSRDDVVSLLDLFETVLDATDITYDSRGQSLLNDVEPRSYISEYHGIPLQLKYNSLKEEFGEEALEKYDKPLRAIASPCGYYGYETVDGFEEIGEAEFENPQSVLSDLAQDIGYADGHSDVVETDETVIDRLRDLGYA